MYDKFDSREGFSKEEQEAYDHWLNNEWANDVDIDNDVLSDEWYDEGDSPC